MGLSIIAALAALLPELALTYMPVLGLAFGAFLFLAGLVFDMRDPGRTTRLSGTGFWLNLFAAPALLTYSVTIANSGWTLNRYFDQATAQAIGEEFDVTRSAIVTLIVMGIFALVSLLINRRALIVAGLLTTGTAIGLLVNESGLGVPIVITFTLVSLGDRGHSGGGTGAGEARSAPAFPQEGVHGAPVPARHDTGLSGVA